MFPMSSSGRAVAARARRVAAYQPLEALEARRLLCDWGWLESVSVRARAAARGAYVSPQADSPPYQHGGSLHVNASAVAPPAPSDFSDTGGRPRVEGSFLLASTGPSIAATAVAGTSTLRIEVGGSKSYTDAAGRIWSADAGFSGGTVSTGTYSVANTADDALYSTRRWGTFSYSRPVGNGAYQLKLHFADPIYTSGTFRKFDVLAENKLVLDNFDIAASGGGKAALVKTFPLVVADGVLSLSFVGVLESAIVSAIELVPDGVTPAQVVARPAAPQELSATAAPASVSLRWKDGASNETGFRIERKDGPSAGYKQIATAPANSTGYVDQSTLLSGTTYTYRVRADNAADASVYSNESSAYVAFGTITWDNGAASPIARAEAARAVVNNKMYVFGGYYNADIQATRRSDVYDPASDTWKRIADMPVAITHQGMVVDGSTVWLVGGYVGDHPGPGTKQVWKYDTIKNTWSRGPDLPDERGAGAAAIVGRRIYFFGGMNEQRTVDMGTLWALDLANQSAGWKRLPDMPNPRNHLTGVALGGKIYAIGGHYQQEYEAVTQREVDRFDPSTGKWTRVADTPTLRSQTPAAAFVYGNRIILVGGADRTQKSTDVIDAYDPSRNRWDTLGRLPAARRATAAGVINSRLVVTTGNDPYPSKTTWISDVLGELD